MRSGCVYCGIDHGTKRIGLAIGNPEGAIASPLAGVDARGPADQVIRRLLDATADFDVAEWVVGLPLNMDGTEGPQAQLVRRFGDHLAGATNKPVHYWDERLSSDTADALLSQSDLTRGKKKSRHDAVAAQVMLQSYLDRKRD
jgi:putative Holliday junction resolvase